MDSKLNPIEMIWAQVKSEVVRKIPPLKWRCPSFEWCQLVKNGQKSKNTRWKMKRNFGKLIFMDLIIQRGSNISEVDALLINVKNASWPEATKCTRKGREGKKFLEEQNSRGNELLNWCQLFFQWRLIISLRFIRSGCFVWWRVKNG